MIFIPYPLAAEFPYLLRTIARKEPFHHLFDTDAICHRFAEQNLKLLGHNVVPRELEQDGFPMAAYASARDRRPLLFRTRPLGRLILVFSLNRKKPQPEGTTRFPRRHHPSTVSD
jgi:hypothetical protein